MFETPIGSSAHISKGIKWYVAPLIGCLEKPTIHVALIRTESLNDDWRNLTATWGLHGAYLDDVLRDDVTDKDGWRKKLSKDLSEKGRAALRSYLAEDYELQARLERIAVNGRARPRGW